MSAAVERVDRALATMRRTWFLPPGKRLRAGEDGPLSIGHGQTNSQPTTVRNMLLLLDVRPGDRVLDVGAGSGWTTALLAELVGPAGEVVGVERVPELAERAARVVRRRVRHPAVTVLPATPDVLGAPERAPFDRILVSAGAEVLPRELVGQLAPGGVLVVPVAEEMTRLEITGAGERITTHGGYRFVPLITG